MKRGESRGRTYLKYSLRFEPYRPAACGTPVGLIDGFVETPYKADKVNPVVDDLFFDSHFGEIGERRKTEENNYGSRRGCK